MDWRRQDSRRDGRLTLNVPHNDCFRFWKVQSWGKKKRNIWYHIFATLLAICNQAVQANVFTLPSGPVYYAQRSRYNYNDASTQVHPRCIFWSSGVRRSLRGFDLILPPIHLSILPHPSIRQWYFSRSLPGQTKSPLQQMQTEVFGCPMLIQQSLLFSSNSVADGLANVVKDIRLSSSDP